MLAWSDAQLERWAAEFAEATFPELKGCRVLCHITRWPRAGYLAAPGFWQRACSLLDAIPAECRVQIAGDLFGAGSMESAMNGGRRAATRIMDVAAV
jgi:protoporphyrinogen/coproporphyrinogen III oxidase